MIKWFRKRREEKRRLAFLESERTTLIDRIRQIEYRLAMCRNVAIDVNAAHNIAAMTLEGRGGPFPNTSSNYQRWCSANAKRDINVR